MALVLLATLSIEVHQVSHDKWSLWSPESPGTSIHPTQTLQLLNRQINGPFWETVLFEPWSLTSKTKEKDKAQLSTELSAAGPAALGVHFHQIPCRCPAMAAGSAAACQNRGKCHRCAEKSGMF